MLEKFFPHQFDNSYRGYKTALWIFGLITAVRTLQSVFIVFNGFMTVRDADGIPIDTYPAEVAQTIVGLFGLISLWRFIFSLLSVIVLVRYRNAVPLMFALLILNFLCAQLLSQFEPLVRVGTPPGPIVNLVLVVLMLIGLVLSLMNRRIHI
jgi:hypothetical protein